MNRLSLERRTLILGLLVEGNSLRATTRLAGISINTVTKLLVDAGRACADYQDGALRNLRRGRIERNEIWSFCFAKEKNVPADKCGQLDYEDVWTWVGTDADTKLVPSFTVGARGAHTHRDVRVEKHASAIALHFMHHNFCGVHESLRVTPAMAAGISDHVWSIGEIAKLLESRRDAVHTT
jgi:hypothetical protein